MDQDTLVDDIQDEGARLIEQLTSSGFPVTVGFWVLASHDGRWYFYIVSPEASHDSGGYRKLHAAIRQLPATRWIDTYAIRLIGPDDPIAKDLLERVDRFNKADIPVTKLGSRLRMLGDLAVEQAVVYPLPAMTA